MLEVFFFATSAILPIMLLILLGYFLKLINIYDDEFLRTANKLVFYVFLPVMLFYNIYGIDNLEVIDFNALLYAMFIIVSIFLLGLATVVFLVKDPRQKGVVLQCTFRSNFAIIGISLAEALGGSRAMANAAVLSAFTIPLFNVLGVISLSMFSKQKNDSINWRKIIKDIIKNPLIIGVVAGLIALVLRSFIPVNQEGKHIFTIADNLPFVYKAIENLAKIASPLALIVLGGQFSFKAANKMLSMVFLGTLWRIVLAPLLALTGAVILTKSGLVVFGAAEFPAFIALFGSPVAVSSSIMAGAMGGDEQLAGQLVVWTSIGPIATIFLQVVVLRFMGVL